MPVHIFRLVLAIDDSLILIKPVIAGYRIADGDSDEIIGDALKSEELQSNQNRSDGAVSDAAEQGGHPGGCA